MAEAFYYYNVPKSGQTVNQGKHRDAGSPIWNKFGESQFNYLKFNGPTSRERLLDIGRDCIFGDIHYFRDLESGSYFGFYFSADLLDAGYELKITGLNLRHKLPCENLHMTSDYDATSFSANFDPVLTPSVFTDLPLNCIKPTPKQLARSMGSEKFFKQPPCTSQPKRTRQTWFATRLASSPRIQTAARFTIRARILTIAVADQIDGPIGRRMRPYETPVDGIFRAYQSPRRIRGA